MDGMLMLKGNGEELLTDLSHIVFALRKKDFPIDAITSAVACGCVRADDEESDKYMDVVVDRDLNKKSEDEPDLEINTEHLDKDTFKKMFGEFFNE